MNQKKNIQVSRFCDFPELLEVARELLEVDSARYVGHDSATHTATQKELLILRLATQKELLILQLAIVL